MRIRFQCNGSIGSGRWELNEEHGTKQDAMMRGRRLALEFACCPWFYSLMVWNMDEDNTLLGEIEVIPMARLKE